MALAERAPHAVLARQADAAALDQERAEGQGLGCGPVEPLAGIEHLLLGRQQAAHGLVQAHAVRGAGQRAADIGHHRGRDAGLAGDIFRAFAFEARPLAVQPVGLVRLVVLADLEFLGEMGLEGGLHVLDLALGDQPVPDQPVGVDLQGGLVTLDVGIHGRVGEHGLIALVMAEPAIAEDVQHHVLVKLLTEFGGDPGRVDDGLGIIAVDVEDRRLDHQRDIGRIGRGAAEMRRGGKADLVVHDDMDRAAGAVAADARKLQAFRHHALAGEGRVAVQQDRQHRGAGLAVAQLVLLGARLAQHDRVHRLQMRGVGGQRQVDDVAVEFAVGGGAEMVFHVARSVHVLGLEAAALEFVEDGAVGF